MFDIEDDEGEAWKVSSNEGQPLALTPITPEARDPSLPREFKVGARRHVLKTRDSIRANRATLANALDVPEVWLEEYLAVLSKRIPRGRHG